MAKNTKDQSSNSITISGDEKTLFEKFKAREQEKKDNAASALAYAEKVKENSESKPDYTPEEHAEYYAAGIPGCFAEVWTGETGPVRGIIVSDDTLLWRKGAMKGEIKGYQKLVFVPEGVQLDDASETLTYMLAIVEGEIIEVGKEVKIPKNFN